ncbi:MAG: hypothetical protein AAGA53_13760 [Pseudomonadota bacterium]
MKEQTFDESNPTQDLYKTIAWFYTACVLAMAVCVWIWQLRSFPDQTDLPGVSPLIKLSSMGLAIVWLRPLANFVSSRHRDVIRFFGVFGLLFLPWWSARFLPDQLADLVPVVSFFLLIVSSIFLSHKAGRANQIHLILLFGAVFGVLLFTAVVGKGYITPDAYQNVLEGTQHRDTMFHAAIAAMIEYQGKVSVGLDGLIPFAYHVLSHRLIGSIANWLDIPILMASYLIVFLVTMPLLFLSLTEAILALKPKGWPPLEGLLGLGLFLCWPLALSLLQTSAYFSSESYILSLIVMLCVIPVAAEWLAKPQSLSTDAMYAVTFAVAILLSASAKISTGAVLAVGISALFFIKQRDILRAILLSVLFVLLPFGFIFSNSLGVEAGSSPVIAPLHFLFEWQQQAVFHIVLTLVTGIVMWRFFKPENHRKRLILPLFAMALAATVSSLLLELPAGAAIYFANPGMWICMLILGALLPVPDGFSRLPRKAQSAIVLIALIGIGLAEKDRWRAILGERQTEATVASNAVQIHRQLAEQMDKQVALFGREFLVYISPAFTEFWKLNRICWAQSFVVPALTGQPMLKGLPPQTEQCDVTVHYGISSYDLNVSSSALLDAEQLCQAAADKGFPAVMRFDTGVGEFINCAKIKEQAG